MYCQQCSRFQDDVGALIRQKRLAYGKDQTEAADARPQTAPDLSTYWPSHEAVLFHNLEELRAAYNTPCPLCRRVFKCIDQRDWASLKTFKAVRTVLMLERLKGKPTLKAILDTDPPIESVRMTARNPVKSTRKLKYLGEHLESLENRDPLIGRLQECASLENASTGSAASVEMARFWLEECLEGHPNCARDNLGWLPTRVIDVGDADGKTPPRLLETADLPSCKSESSNPLVFVALSHCWGSKQIITTTTSTLTDRKRSIDFRDLPKTFQDAVITIHRLGLRYLWIDSLCIIQDSVDDWMKESVQMSTIYRRALFTIMAAHASGGNEGCFVKRDGLARLPLTLRFNAPDKSEAWNACFQLPDHGQGLMPKFKPILFTRAWVLQEQFNSRAKLIFFGEEVHWECVTMSGSEQRPLDGKKIWDVIDGSMSLVADNSDDSVDDPYYGLEWYELVNNYTRRGITKSSDRLIAIDGIAQSVQTRTSDRYIAGLWAQGLPLGLMWYIPWTLAKSGPWHALEKEAKTYLSSRHEQVLAPSWSWASTTFPVNWFPLYDKGITPTCDVLHADAHGTPFNTSGTLILRGMTRTLFVSPYYQTLHFTGTTTPNPLLSTTPSSLKSNNTWRHHLTYVSSKHPSWRHRLAPVPVELFPDEILDTSLPITFLALGTTPAGTFPLSLARRYTTATVTASRRLVYTLALQATADDPHTLRRVGIAAWSNCAWFGYFCVGKEVQRGALTEMLSVWEEKGWVAVVMAMLAVLWVWVWETVFGLAVMRVYDKGVVWFRGLVKGSGGRHGCDGDIMAEATYREGCGAEVRTVRVV